MTTAELCLEILQSNEPSHSEPSHTRVHKKQDCYMLYANKCKVEAISISFCATHKHADMYKTPHSQRLSQPAPPPSSRKTSTLLNQVPASCHREATGDAPLSLGAESHPRSSSLILPLSPAESTSLPLLLPLRVPELQMVRCTASSQMFTLLFQLGLLRLHSRNQCWHDGRCHRH